MTQEKVQFKSHPLMIISELGRFFYLILFSIFGNLSTLKDLFYALKTGELMTVLSELKTQSLWALGIILCVFALYLFFAWRKYYLTSYELSADSLTVFSNRLHKSKLLLAKKDISNISLSQTLLQRICGLYQISINTNTSSTANQTDVKLFLKEAKAHWLEESLKTTNEIESQVEKTPFIYEKSYTKKEVFYHALLSVSCGELVFFLLVFSLILGINLISQAFNIRLPEFYLALHSLTKGYLSLGVFLTMLWLYGLMILRLFIRYYHFELKQSEDDKLYLSHGLITKKSYILPLEKIQALVIKQHGFARVFGFYALEAINIGFDDEKNETPCLLLYGRKDQLAPLSSTILKERQPSTIKNQAKKTYFIYLFKALPSLIFLTLTLFYFIDSPYRYLIFLYWLYRLAFIYLDYLTKGFSLEKNHLICQTGVYEKITYYVKIKAVEQLQFKSSPVARLLKKTLPTLFIMGSEKYVKGISHFGYYADSCLLELKNLLKK